MAQCVILTHFEAEFIVILVECNIHQAATKTVVWENQENVLENLMNVSEILSSRHTINCNLVN